MSANPYPTFHTFHASFSSKLVGTEVSFVFLGCPLLKSTTFYILFYTPGSVEIYWYISYLMMFDEIFYFVILYISTFLSLSCFICNLKYLSVVSNLGVIPFCVGFHAMTGQRSAVAPPSASHFRWRLVCWQFTRFVSPASVDRPIRRENIFRYTRPLPAVSLLRPLFSFSTSSGLFFTTFKTVSFPAGRLVFMSLGNLVAGDVVSGCLGRWRTTMAAALF